MDGVACIYSSSIKWLVMAGLINQPSLEFAFLILSTRLVYHFRIPNMNAYDLDPVK